MEKLTLNKMTGKDNDNTQTINLIENEPNPIADEISLRAIDELLNLEKLKTISRVKPEQVSNLVKLYAFADTFKTAFPRSLADYVLQLQISLNGLGRRELVQLVQQRGGELMLDQRPQTSKNIFK